MHFPPPSRPLRNARQLTIRFAYCASLAAIAVLGLTPLPFLATKVATAEPPGWYGRVDAGFETGTSARFRDWNCGGTDPAAIPLYGCLARASGDFGRSAAFGGGIGYRIDERFRIDLTVGWRPGFGFDGQANFPVAGGQAVDGEVSTLSGMVTGYLDLAPLVALDLGPFQPFVGLGAGVSRNRLDRTTLSFPGISQTVTTPGGTSTGFAWTATAGTGIRLTDALTLEIAYRYTDFGRVDSDRGDATRVRTSGTVSLPIDGTRSDLASHGISIGLRHAFDAAGVPHESAPAFVRGNPIVSAGYDFPTFVGRARPYLLAESPRSGSQLLADLLWRTGRMGAPGEYFNREHTIPALTQRLGLASIDGPGGMDAYIRALVRHRTSANGVFGVKAHFSQLRPHLDDPSVRALVRGSRIVWLRRRDLVAQAISYLVALQSDEWRRLRGRDGATFQGRYSWRDIDRAVGMIAADERCWQVGFEQSGITPFVVWYEDLVADPDPACRGICALMGVADGLPPFALAASPLERQADPVKEEWLRRYRQTLDWGPKSPRARSAARAT